MGRLTWPLKAGCTSRPTSVGQAQKKSRGKLHCWKGSAEASSKSVLKQKRARPSLQSERKTLLTNAIASIANIWIWKTLSEIQKPLSAELLHDKKNRTEQYLIFKVYRAVVLKISEQTTCYAEGAVSQQSFSFYTDFRVIVFRTPLSFTHGGISLFVDELNY